MEAIGTLLLLPRLRQTIRFIAAAAVLALILTSCSVRKLAISKLGDSLAGGSSAYATDDDPELVAQALPFSLKLIESLLAEVPEHHGLLLTASSGYTQYAYAFVQQEADRLENDDLQRATRMHDRAARLFLRGRGYGLRGLDAAHPNFSKLLAESPDDALAAVTKKDVPLLYWTAAAWGGAIALSKTDPERIGDQPLVEALMDRALELDEGFDSGAIHGFLIAYEPSRQGVAGDYAERSRRHFDRAVALSKGQMAAPYVALAEAVSIPKQDRVEYERLLAAALAVDADARPEWRLANTIARQRAHWLLSRADELFLDEAADAPAPHDTQIAQQETP